MMNGEVDQKIKIEAALRSAHQCASKAARTQQAAERKEWKRLEIWWLRSAEQAYARSLQRS